MKNNFWKSNFQPGYRKRTWVILSAALLLAACASSPQTPAAPSELIVMTHDSFAASEQSVQAFEKENNLRLVILPSGDTGTALNKAILAKNNPIADVFYGVDNTFLSRALEEDIFQAYRSPALADIPSSFQLDAQFRALPVDYGDVCLNYDRAYFEDAGLAPPQSLEDLLKPEYKSLAVVENPATSSPGLAFLLATIDHFGDPGYLEYWRALRQNDLLVVNDWNTAYYTEFTRAGGTRPIVLSYSSSPVFEVIFGEAPEAEESPTAAIVSPGSCFRQVEFVGILKGTQNPEMAQKWVDFMLSAPFQQDLALQMYVFPVNPGAKLDETFEKFLVEPQQPASLDPQAIATNRERWLQEWAEVVLR